MSAQTKPRRKCKRCDKWLKVYIHREFCDSCWFLHEFRPWEFDPQGWERRTLQLATLTRP